MAQSAENPKGSGTEDRAEKTNKEEEIESGGAKDSAEKSADGEELSREEGKQASEGGSEESQAEQKEEKPEEPKETEEAKLTRELSELEEKVKAKKHELLLAFADFENNKKRYAKERESRQRTATAGFAGRMVGVFTEFEELVVDHGEQSREAGQALLEGVVLTRDLYRTTLEKFDVKPMSTEPGEPFVSARHELSLEDDSKPTGAVTETLRLGWVFEPRGAPPVVIQKAQVKVE